MSGQHTFHWFKQSVTTGTLNLSEGEQPEPCAKGFQLSKASWARLNGLSQTLNIEPNIILEQLIGCAMGDAHDGFLAAFEEVTLREQANAILKNRVKALLSE